MNKKDFIIGKWYNTSIDNNYYFKFNGWLDSKTIAHTDTISRGFYNMSTISNSTWWGNPSLITDLSIIDQFLPEGHPDKLSTQIQTKDDYEHLKSLLKQITNE